MSTRTNPELAAILGPEGPIAAALAAAGASFEPRPQQIEMAQAVAERLEHGGHALLEAGTGVGKSFAYLVPALRWAQALGKRVAVATSTIALQEQLVGKDLPLLAEALPFPVEYALVKGRGNYLCTRRMLAAVADHRSLVDPDEESEDLEHILQWSRGTTDGSRQDLPFRPREGVWDLVKAEQGNCLGRACEHYQRCHYQRSRRAAWAAPLLILNHHVLVADLALKRSGQGFLPKVDAIVIDEAHDFEDVAAEHLGLRVSSRGTLRVVGRLWNEKRGRGLLRRTSSDVARRAVENARQALRTGMRSLGRQIAGEGEDDARTHPLDPELSFDEVVPERLSRLAATIRDCAQAAGEQELGMELMASARSLADAAEGWQLALGPVDTGYVRWAETDRFGGVTLCRAPVDVGSLLGKVLWDSFPTVILTSATLATGRPPNFGFLSKRLGIVDAAQVSVGSPFHYRDQARLVVRADLPPPGPGSGAYEDALPEAIFDAVEATNGGTFVLFTSYRQMQRTAERLSHRFEAMGWPLYVQGAGLERMRMIEAFRREPGVLFGVASFWQGVDVSGDALRHVVIVRIPFEVPTHPLQVARHASITKRGGDPFRELSLPTAALKLKQGFGRLIRSSTDEGMVTILDSRIHSRRYGRFLLDSLPDCPVDVVR